jgi:hypothetical protein
MKTADMIATLDAWHTTLTNVMSDPAVIDCDDRLSELKDEIAAMTDRFRDGETVS